MKARLIGFVTCAVLMAACSAAVRVVMPNLPGEAPSGAGAPLPPTHTPVPPLPAAPDSTVIFDTVICAQPAHIDHCDAPIAGATVVVDDNDEHGPRKGISNADGYNVWSVESTLLDTFLTVDAPGYDHYDSGTVHPVELAKQHNIITLTQSWPQPQAAAPLVLEPNDPTGLVCPHDAIVPIPSGPDRRFWRGDAWGTTLPGAPFVSGGSARHPERILTWFFDRYAPQWQLAILKAYRARGYTHFTLSWPDSRDGAGQNAVQFAQTATQVHQAIPYVHVMLTSKDFDAANADAPTRMATVSPAVDALIAAGFTGENLILGVGWELDTFNEGQRLEDFIHALHAKYPQFDLYVHFTTYKTSWQPDGQPRAQFWQATQGELTGLLYQGNQNDPCGLMAAHFNDAQVPASGIRQAGAVLVPWELVAANEFDGDHPNEDDANARSWAILQTPGPIPASGFGNGSRFPSGAPTLSAYPVSR